MNLEKLIRKNILNMKKYESARALYNGEDFLFLDANENYYFPRANEGHLYPDSNYLEMRKTLSRVTSFPYENIWPSIGSGTLIDATFRVFAGPGDCVFSLDPSFSLYQNCSEKNGTELVKIKLEKDFSLDFDKLYKKLDQKNPKVLFICTPNNPTGNSFDPQSILKALDYFEGVVVVDEAYADFSSKDCCSSLFLNNERIILLRTFSKSFALAGQRIGYLVANSFIVDQYRKVLGAYDLCNLNSKIVQNVERELLDIKSIWPEIKIERMKLKNELEKLSCVEEVFSSDANFLLIRFKNAIQVFDYLIQNKIIVRNMGHLTNCDNCLRITIGLPEHNITVIEILKKYIGEL